MRIVPFPTRNETDPEQDWLAELDAALSGQSTGAVAESWRELRADVRATAPPMTAEFRRELGERIAQRSTPLSYRERARRRLGRLPRRLAHPGRAGPAGAAAIVLAGVLALMFVAGPWRSGRSEFSMHSALLESPASAPGAASGGAVSAHKGDAEALVAVQLAAPPAGPAQPSVRVQQLAASISLAASAKDIQATADRVSQLAVSDGGYVQSSHVQVQRGGTNEASLTLQLPSAKLSSGLASLGALAPVRSESQSLQDITDEYSAARRRVADADAERQALLRALSAATTEGQIDSLRERLSANRSTIAQARSTVQALSRRAGTAEVAVTILADARSGSEGLTFHRGLHDAGRVLTVAAVVLLIALAVLVPLALLLAAMLGGRSVWRRRRRERALDVR
jgi:hypothetical protein